jgi:hypothetical protein
MKNIHFYCGDNYKTLKIKDVSGIYGKIFVLELADFF